MPTKPMHKWPEKGKAHAIIVLVSIISGIFLADLITGDIKKVTPLGILLLCIISIFIFYLAWFLYPFWVSKQLKLDFSSFLYKDAITFAPFFLLAIFPIRHFIPLGEFSEFATLPSLLIGSAALALFLAMKVLLFPKEIRFSVSRRALWMTILIGFIVLSSLSILKHYAFYSTGVDLGIYDQAIYGYSQGKLFYSIMRFPLLGMHVEPILFLFVPLYWIAASPVWLFLAQSAALSLSILPLFLIAKKFLRSSGASYLVALSLLFFPTVGFAALFDFHPAALAVLFSLAAIYFLLEKRLWSCLAFLVLLGLTKETFTLLIVPFGIYAFFVFRRRLWGVGVALLGIVWLLVDFAAVMPQFAAGPNVFLAANPYFGDTLGEAVTTAITRPLYTLQFLFHWEKLAFVGLLLFPVGILLPFLGYPFLLFALTELGIVLLYNQMTLQQIVYHHPLLIVPFLFVGACAGIRKLALRVSGKNAVLSGAALVFLLSIFASLSYGPFALLYDLDEFSPGKEYIKTGYEMLSKIPGDAAIAAPNWVMPHLSEREDAFTLRHFIRTDRDKFISGEWRWPEYIIMDLSEAVVDPKRSGNRVTAEEISSLFTDAAYGITEANGTWLLLKRGADLKEGICKVAPFLDKKKFPYLDVAIEKESIAHCPT